MNIEIIDTYKSAVISAFMERITVTRLFLKMKVLKKTNNANKQNVIW